ncbi:hypothetical protein ACFX13_036645 [Malus domestica]
MKDTRRGKGRNRESKNGGTEDDGAPNQRNPKRRPSIRTSRHQHNLVGSHPLESALESAKLTQEQINTIILGYTYGSAFPLKMDSLLDSKGMPDQFLLQCWVWKL